MSKAKIVTKVGKEVLKTGRKILEGVAVLKVAEKMGDKEEKSKEK